MSKATLKKALAPLSKEQIEEMVLDLYAARPEAKEYLDFWVSGDIDSKMTKAKTAVAKEIARKQRLRPRPRMTKIKRFIKDIVSLNADSQAVCEIMTFAVEKFCSAGSESWIKENTQKSCAKLLHDTLVYARTTGELSFAAPRLETAIDAMQTNHWWNRDFKTLLKDEFDDTMASFTQ
ncbi:MAG: hypothetical protein HFJ94_09190 [Muribaculaceae bacterium]|nr:hypothetical protein [Muribaculaceae bacterium]